MRYHLEDLRVMLKMKGNNNLACNKHKILILCCNTGQGHNSAGLAILEELTRRNAECEKRDAYALEFLGEKTSRMVSGSEWE